MSNSNKHATKLITGLCMAVFFSSVAASSANALPSAEDINSLAEKVKLTGDAFMQESFEPRMKYECSGQFLNPNDKENLHKLAKTAGNQLRAIEKKQQELKKQIEDYQGDDWDAKYGSTGLWRKLSSDLYKTALSKCEIDLYLALTAAQQQRNNILHKILTEIDSLDLLWLPAASQLLKAKVLALLAQTDHAYKHLAEKEHSTLMIRSDMRHSTALRISIERIKLLGPTNTNDLDKLTETIAKSSCADNIELVLSLASLQRKLNRPEGLEKIVSLWPQIEDFLGSLILSDLSHQIAQQQNLQQISVLEAELAAQAAWKNETKDYKTLLDYLSKTEKFQTPLILYVSAVNFAGSSPAKAVNLLVEASKLQKMKKSDRLDVEPDKIAGQAAQLAYNLFVQAPANNKQGCQIALEAFENYYKIADGKIDEEFEYLYSVILNDCGQIENRTKLLQKIADRPTGNYRDVARLELIVHAIQQKQYEKPDQKSRLVKQFSNLITNHNECEYAGEAMELLSEIIDEIDQVQVQIDEFSKMMRNCKKIAEFCYNCHQNQQSGLILAEISVFEADKDMDKLSEAEKLLKNLTKNGMSDELDLLRCRARLLAEQSKFGEAAELWAKICKMRKSEITSANQRSWKWWRAKFYELDCWAKYPQTQKEEISHTIEVLENSFSDIPLLWAEKLSLLKQQCL